MQNTNGPSAPGTDDLSQLPGDVAAAVQPLFDRLPLNQAMVQLVVAQGAAAELRSMVESVMRHPAIASNSGLQAGLWLYVDELDRSHRISQSDHSATGSYWHGIMHRREGDFSNSHYWFRKTGRHPAMLLFDEYDGHAFIDEVEAGYRGSNTAGLIEKQRREWANLFAWCAAQGQ